LVGQGVAEVGKDKKRVGKREGNPKLWEFFPQMGPTLDLSLKFQDISTMFKPHKL